jgi:hypothetical protein
MIWNLKIGVIMFFSLCFFLQSEKLVNENNPIIKEHSLLIKHPGEEEPIEVVLVEVQNKEGLPIEYYMDVKSVICLKGLCKIIPVRLYWDNIGVYKKYKLKGKATLEKYKADLFEPSDYLKLQSILANPNSPFKDIRLSEVVTVVNELDTNEVDAVSGATTLELDEKDTVPGAALTCYTLWHWANGAVVSKIQNQTGSSVSIKQLEDFILNENNSYFYIAINEIHQRNAFTKSVIDVVIRKILLDDSLVKTSFQYFEKTKPEQYFYAAEKLFYEGGKNLKLAAIQSLKTTKYQIPVSYLDHLSFEIKNMKSFQEISLFLGLIELKKPNSNIIIQNVLPSLKADFLTARRVYWFLINEKLSDEQKQKVNEFQEKYKNQL